MYNYYLQGTVVNIFICDLFQNAGATKNYRCADGGAVGLDGAASTAGQELTVGLRPKQNFVPQVVGRASLAAQCFGQRHYKEYEGVATSKSCHMTKSHT